MAEAKDLSKRRVVRSRLVAREIRGIIYFGSIDVQSLLMHARKMRLALALFESLCMSKTDVD